MTNLPAPARFAAHVFLDALSVSIRERDPLRRAVATAAELERINKVEGALVADFDYGNGRVDLNAGNLFSGVLRTIDRLVHGLADARGVDAGTVIRDVRDFLDS